MEELMIVDGEEVTIEVEFDQPAAGGVALQGERIKFACFPLGGEEYLLVLGKKNIPFFRFFSAGDEFIFIEGETYVVRKATGMRPPRTRAAQERERAVTPPMPAQVIRLPVSPGQEVKRGEALVVLSAMKMEMTLTAPRDGRVARVNTSVGAQVMPGEILVEVEESKGGGDGAGT